MRRVLIPLCASALILTACTTTTGGSASPSSSAPDQTSVSGSTTGVPGQGVPKVETPLDITHFKQAPCDALSADQIAELLGAGVTPKPDLNAPSGPSCNVNPPRTTQASVLVTFTDVDDRGLTSIYQHDYTFFLPLKPVDGYPVAAYGLADERTDGRCQIAIGTSDQQTVDVTVTQSEDNIDRKDPCEAARGVASYVLGNIRGRK
ncbi:DUF3558 domain-containing protein [Amycolatopsis sp. NPDC051045]|uniref:DUF3558 domain-containing protein n=1 Tax=Amycolatopsis sp. NPDC051045 TaxID=3156922 RepID=UPI003427F2B9